MKKIAGVIVNLFIVFVQVIYFLNNGNDFIRSLSLFTRNFYIIASCFILFSILFVIVSIEILRITRNLIGAEDSLLRFAESDLFKFKMTFNKILGFIFLPVLVANGYINTALLVFFVDVITYLTGRFYVPIIRSYVE